MTLADFKTLLASSNIPVAYQMFPADSCPELPIVTFQETYTSNFKADGKVYKGITHIQVDLYTSTKDTVSESAIETALSDFPWDKEQSYNDNEKVYRYTYDVSIVK